MFYLVRKAWHIIEEFSQMYKVPMVLILLLESTGLAIQGIEIASLLCLYTIEYATI
jgi:hypothetical protein